jgi:hypothetical protein
VTLLVIDSFVLPLVLSKGAFSLATNTAAGIVLLFLFYVISYFVVIFSMSA